MEIVRSYIAGQWYEAPHLHLLPVENPATGETVGSVQMIDAAGLDAALQSAAEGFAVWRAVSAYDRARIMRAAVEIIRSRKDSIARWMTLEQGKPLSESVAEVVSSADNIEWTAEEATRAYGRLLVPRNAGVTQMVRREPIGPVASFAPWNFPALTPARKIAGALAAGCSVILKPSEETPFTAAEIVRAFVDAGLPPHVLNLVYGGPEQVSTHLIDSPVIRKISFTGSTTVGKRLMARAAGGVKRATMELGGHAPVVVFDDVDPVQAAQQAAVSKFRNAGQVCTSPTRFYVQAGIYPAFVEAFVTAARMVKLGDGMEAGTQMGPLANSRRLAAMQQLVSDTLAAGAKLECGGTRVGDTGYYFAPTVFTGVSDGARVMQEEPFGPLVPIVPFTSLEEVKQKVNSTPYGLAAYVMTRSLARATAMSEHIEAGMVCVNYFAVATPASPFGGVKESGYGSEGGIEGLDAYLATKTITQRTTGADLD